MTDPALVHRHRIAFRILPIKRSAQTSRLLLISETVNPQAVYRASADLSPQNYMRFTDQVIPMALREIRPGLLRDSGTSECSQLRHRRAAGNLPGWDIDRRGPAADA